MKREEILKIGKPILFNTEMVQAILEGRKAVTRRVIKPKYSNTHFKFRESKYGREFVEMQNEVEGETFGKNPDRTTWHKLLGYVVPKPSYRIGDILYVRETWTTIDEFENYADLEIDKDLRYLYKCDDNGKEHTFIDVGVKKWKPSIHMPKEVARIFLKVTDVRVERLQDIDKLWSNYDKEGMRNPETENISIAMQEKFIDVWNSTIKKQDFDKYGWEANPWVWVIEFERVEAE